MCGQVHGWWVCVAPAGHALDAHYFVKADEDGLCPAGVQLALL